jgi:hypothetical protein
LQSEVGGGIVVVNCLLVVISRHRKDLPALNPSPIRPNPRLASHTKITQEIKNIIEFHGRIQPVDNCLVHLFGGRKRPTAVADDIGVSEMEIGGEPRAWHRLNLKRCPLLTFVH